MQAAIVAAEVRTALAADLDGTWEALLGGRNAVRAVDSFDASGFGTPHAAIIPEGSEKATGDPMLRVLGFHGRILGDVLRRAHDAADGSSVPREAVGLYVACPMVDSPIEDLTPAVLASRDESGALDLGVFFRSAYRNVHPLWPLSTLNNIAAGQLATDLDVRGDNLVLSSGADAGLRAVVEGAQAVRSGEVRVALVGAASEAVTPASLARLKLRGQLGDGRPCPFSHSAAGIAPGEGGGSLVLEPLSAARHRGQRPLGVLRGGATVFGPRDEAAATLARAMREAIADAELEAVDLDSVFLHGEGTSLDAAELSALEQVFGTRRAELALTATKGALGHLGEGSPVVDVALAVHALSSGRLPATVTGESLEAGAAGILRASSHAPRRVLVVAAGSAGGAGGVVVEGVS